ncbi:MAG: TadE/TadG family type IV pilus assembly protein [Hyphomicrobiaceae bacterium]
MSRRGFLGAASQLGRDNRGTTAIEFALVAMPFLTILFGIIAAGLFFFVTFSMENAVERASRLIRTGQAQLNGMKTDEFKLRVCEHTPGFVDCANKLRVNVQRFTTFAGVVNAQCTDTDGNLIPEPAPTNVPGNAGDVILVTVCYEWELAGYIPFLEVGKMPNGSALIQAATTFRTEPFQ